MKRAGELIRVWLLYGDDSPLEPIDGDTFADSPQGQCGWFRTGCRLVPVGATDLWELDTEILCLRRGPCFER